MSQQSFILSDGSNDAALLNTTPSGTEYGLAVRIIGAAAGGTSSLFTSAFPSSGTAAGFTDGTNMQAAFVFDLDSGGGTQYVLGTNLRFTSNGGSVEAGTASNPLRIDPTGSTTQPISGTVTANQGGTWTVQPGNTQNTTPWLTQDAADGPVGAGTAASKSILTGGQYNSSLPSLSTGQQAALQVDSSGRLLVGSIASALPTGANTIGSVTQASGPWTQNITQFGGNAVVTGTGASGSGIPRVTVANDSNILATQSGTWTVQQGGAPWSVIGTKTNNSATPSTNNTGTLPAVANTSAPSYTDGYQVALSVDTGGALRAKEVRAATSNVTSVTVTSSNTTLLASNANRLGATIFNESTKILYIKFGATASITSYTTQIPNGGYYELPFNYTGQIDGLWSANDGTKAARITELTA